MPPRRQRATCTGNVRFNDVVVTGQTLIILGKTNQRGETKDAKGKALKKKDLTHYKLRFEDASWVKNNNLQGFYEFVVDDSGFQKFYSKDV